MNGDYSLAVHALVYLDHRNTHLPSQILAENICTNAARVRKVMRPVAEATGTTFVDANWKPGDIHEECLVSSSMGAVIDGIYDGLNRTCLEQLAHTTIHDITEQIFSGASSQAN